MGSQKPMGLQQPMGLHQQDTTRYNKVQQGMTRYNNNNKDVVLHLGYVLFAFARHGPQALARGVLHPDPPPKGTGELHRLFGEALRLGGAIRHRFDGLQRRRSEPPTPPVIDQSLAEGVARHLEDRRRSALCVNCDGDGVEQLQDNPPREPRCGRVFL